MISLVECSKMGHCPNPADITKGTTLFLGAFDPEFPTSTTTPDQEPQQNFTVIVPSSLTPGRTAQLTVTHLSLVGVSGFPFFFFLAWYADKRIPGIASGLGYPTD